MQTLTQNVDGVLLAVAKYAAYRKFDCFFPRFLKYQLSCGCQLPSPSAEVTSNTLFHSALPGLLPRRIPDGLAVLTLREIGTT